MQFLVHDLRSPLSALQGYLGLLREEVDGKPQALGYLDDANTLVDKVLGLVATILDVDELEDGILRAHPASVRLGDLVERARSGNRASFEMRELAFQVDVPDDMIVRLDRDLMGRVIENLVDNACRYSPRGGKVAISAKRDEPKAELEARAAPRSGAGIIEIAVGNTGPSVPAAERERIFGRYHQVEARRVSARQNRGLGLYFCKLAAEAHGGTIHVEERGELGAVFVVRLPE
jgi:signal transduction histidine kinase